MKTTYDAYKKKGHQLSSDRLAFLESHLEALDQAIQHQDRDKASQLAHSVETFGQDYFKKNSWDYVKEMALAILIALLIATVVRQMWFELYEIPTGSMRPTFKEQDHLTVTKTTFGLNVPLDTAHFYFDPSLVQRTGVVIWSGDGVPHLDSDSTFMKIFPYTKRYIKRCMGKPGDTLYFYGGKIFGMDKEGNDLTELRNSPHLTKLDHVPFTNFEGRRSYVQDSAKRVSQAVFHHFNQLAGRYRFLPPMIHAEVFNGKEWIKDNPLAQRSVHDNIQTYSDLWGIRNTAIARLLTKEQVEKLTSFSADEMEEGLLYLELRHTPSLSYPQPILSDYFGAAIIGYSTVIPLQKKHLKALMDHMYTSRFHVQNGKAFPYRLDSARGPSQTSPLFPQVPDGTYEFYYGQALNIGFGGIATALPEDHPLYSHQPGHIQKLFNVGIEMNTQIEPRSRNQPFFPNRYVYFRNGDLYAMGGKLMDKTDPYLESFHKREQQREKVSTQQHPYVAFKDYGPPLKDSGELDKEFLRTFGFTIPEGHYLMLGDNHAMSQDSRSFGPVPQANLQGSPSLIIWPPGERWGIPNQKPYPLLTTPRVVVWSIVALISLVWYLIRNHNRKKPVFKKIEF